MSSESPLASIIIWPVVGSAAWLLVLGALALVLWRAPARRPRVWDSRTIVSLCFVLVTAAAATWALVRMLFFSSMLSDPGGWWELFLAALSALVASGLIARTLFTRRAAPASNASEASGAPRRRLELLVAGALSLLGGLVLFAMLVDVMQPPCTNVRATGPAPSVTWEREAVGRAIPLKIVGLDGDRYHLTRQIRIDVDSWERDTESAVPLETEGLAVLIDGAWIPGSFTIQTRQERGEGLALVLVVAGDEGLDPLLPAIGEGLDALAQTLAPADTVRVWSDAAKDLRPPSPGPAPRAADPVGAVARALKQMMRLDAQLPTRRHILLIGSGRPGVVPLGEKAFDEAVGLAAELGVRVDAVEIDDAQPAANIEELAVRTNGAVRKIQPTQGGPSMRAALASYGRELASRSIVTFSPTDYCGKDSPAHFELAARSSDGRFGRDMTEEVKVVPLPLD